MNLDMKRTEIVELMWSKLKSKTFVEFSCTVLFVYNWMFAENFNFSLKKVAKFLRLREWKEIVPISINNYKARKSSKYPIWEIFLVIKLIFSNEFILKL